MTARERWIRLVYFVLGLIVAGSGGGYAGHRLATPAITHQIETFFVTGRKEVLTVNGTIATARRFRDAGEFNVDDPLVMGKAYPSTQGHSSLTFSMTDGLLMASVLVEGESTPTTFVFLASGGASIDRAIPLP